MITLYFVQTVATRLERFNNLLKPKLVLILL